MKRKQVPNECFFAWVEAELEAGRSVRFRVKGRSMLPLLRGLKDEVVVAPCPDGALRRGEAVLFRYRGRHVLHRVVGRSGDRYRMQGDGVWTACEECGRADIVGVVRKVVRPSGRVVETRSMLWRLESRLWRGLGPLRGWALRGFAFLARRLGRLSA